MRSVSRSPRSTSIGRVSTLAAVATATGAQAAIITNANLGVSGFTSGSMFEEGNQYWNIDNAGIAEAYVHNIASTSSSIIYSQSKHIHRNGNGFGVVANTSSMLALNAGQLIGPGNSFVSFVSMFQSGQMESVVNFVSGTTTYIGFRFTPAGTTLYGWAEVTLTNGGNFGAFTLHSWAYDDTGAAITAGQTSAIPEPASIATGLGALAMGAAALRRKRRDAQALNA